MKRKLNVREQANQEALEKASKMPLVEKLKTALQLSSLCFKLQEALRKKESEESRKHLKRI